MARVLTARCDSVCAGLSVCRRAYLSVCDKLKASGTIKKTFIDACQWPDDNGNFGHVEIKPCGPAFCGTLIQSFDGTGAVMQSDNVGKQIVWDMMAAGDGSYTGGKIWSPDRDKTYNSTMQLTGDTLSVSGCVFGGLICRASDWTRVK